MNSLQSSLYTAAIALCLFSAGILSGRKNRTGIAVTYFTVFLALESLGFVLELLMIHPAAPLKGLWLGLRMATSLLVAPCLWLAVRENVEGERPRLSSLGRGHLWPVFAGVVLLLPLMEDAHLGLTYFNEQEPASLLHTRFIHATMLICVGVFAVQVPYYLWQCRRLLLSASGASKWLQFPLVVAFTTWLVGLLRTVQCASHAPQGLGLLFALTDVSVTVGAIYMLVRRVPELEVPETTVASPKPAAPPPIEATPEVACAPSPRKYARSNLDPATRERICRKLKVALATQAICHDSLLNLRSLSRSINEKAHYVSQVINQDLNSTFYELVNRHRIEEAKKLLVHAPDQTVLEIALTVGFNSKSTFNTAFRQYTGKTPSEYRSE